MGSGKSTYGKTIGDALNLPFIDLDAEIEMADGMNIRDIFEQKGEAYFREKERELLRSLSVKKDFIMATGGGTPCFFDNIQFMKEKGKTIYLKARVDEIIKRLKVEGIEQRPLLMGKDEPELYRYITQQIGQREQFYNKAEIKIESNDASVQNLIAKLK